MSLLKKKEERKAENLAPIFQWAGALSGLQKILIFLITFALVGAGYYYFLLKPKYEKINKLKQSLKTKKQTLVIYKAKAKSLPELEKKLNTLKEELNYAVAALPDEKEIPILLTEISRAGNKSGLEFINFKPKPEQIKEGFYAEIPVDMIVTGRFHQLVHFFDELSRLYRIVNINNIKMNGTKSSKKLKVSCQAVTYMFVDRKPTTNQGKKGKK